MKYRLSALFMAGLVAFTMPVCAKISIDSVGVFPENSTVEVSGKTDKNRSPFGKRF